MSKGLLYILSQDTLEFMEVKKSTINDRIADYRKVIEKKNYPTKKLNKHIKCEFCSTGRARKSWL